MTGNEMTVPHVPCPDCGQPRPVNGFCTCPAGQAKRADWERLAQRLFHR